MSKRELWAFEYSETGEWIVPGDFFETRPEAEQRQAEFMLRSAFPTPTRIVRYVPAEEDEHTARAAELLRIATPVAGGLAWQGGVEAWLKRDRELGKDGDG